jgi:ABC-2 type transport system permease protein
MSALFRELAFLMRTTAGAGATLLTLGLASVAVALGLQTIHRQEAAIARMLEMQAIDEAAVQRFAKTAGDAAYYTFYPTWDAPAPLAFAAIGQRDANPTMLRIRMLALEGQIHENDNANPESTLAGRFDFAFVLIYIAPLVLIALLHDLWSGERAAGRLALLQTTPRATWRVFATRAGSRALAIFMALATPFTIGALLSRAAPLEIVQATLWIAGLIIFWTCLCLMIAAQPWRAVTHAGVLCGLWFALTLVAPAGANLAINAAIPLPSGAELARENREAVHDAWDLPRQDTLDRFVALYPEWRTEPMERPFEWKWYYAFQHLGDVQVQEMSRAYRAGVMKRERAAGAISWVLTPIAFQRGLFRLARTDVESQLTYQDRVRAYHDTLRAFYYPYLFHDRPFSAGDFAKAPRFKAL